jgi:hypothetical protein
VADDLDDLDEAKGDPQPPQGRELVIVDLGHPAMMPSSWPGHRPATLAGAVRDSIDLGNALRPRRHPLAPGS